MNRVDLIGHLGRDPEKRTMQGGDPVVTLNLATTERWKDKATQESRERTEWHKVVVFNPPLCEIAEKYLRKGSKVRVSGQLQTRKWQDQTGNDRYSTEVVLQRFRGELELLDKREGSSADYSSHQDGNVTGDRSVQRPAASGDDLDDDVPF